MLQEISLDLIDPDPNQPRKHFDEASLEELAASILEQGLAVSILVRPNEDRFTIVHGERRYRAVEMLGWDAIPAEVRDVSPDQAFMLALIENIQRSDLSPIEEAQAFAKLQKDRGMSQTEIANFIGKSQQFVAGRLSLLKLEPEVQEMVTTRVVNPSIGTRLADIDDPKFQKSLAKRVVQNNFTVKHIEKAKKDWKSKQVEEQSQSVFFEDLVDIAPELKPYSTAVNNGEISVAITDVKMADGEVIPHPSLKIKDVTHPFEGQSWHWPKYTGIQAISCSFYWNERGDTDEEALQYPLFSEEEWVEWIRLNEADLLKSVEFTSHDWFHWDNNDFASGFQDPRIRRDFDPEYGRFLTSVARDNTDLPLFVRQGWGEWIVVEFNDGHGGRTRRRYFQHDYITSTLIKEAMETVDPFSFSEFNFQRLNIWQVQGYTASWSYFRRKTILREEAIAALEKDLEMLRNTEELSNEEFEEKVLDFLQECIPKLNEADRWNEGVCTVPRLPDGTVDYELNQILLARED